MTRFKDRWVWIVLVLLMIGFFCLGWAAKGKMAGHKVAIRLKAIEQRLEDLIREMEALEQTAQEYEDMQEFILRQSLLMEPQ